MKRSENSYTINELFEALQVHFHPKWENDKKKDTILLDGYREDDQKETIAWIAKQIVYDNSSFGKALRGQIPPEHAIRLLKRYNELVSLRKKKNWLESQLKRAQNDISKFSRRFWISNILVAFISLTLGISALSLYSNFIQSVNSETKNYLQNVNCQDSLMVQDVTTYSNLFVRTGLTKIDSFKAQAWRFSEIARKNKLSPEEKMELMSQMMKKIANQLHTSRVQMDAVGYYVVRKVPINTFLNRIKPYGELFSCDPEELIQDSLVCAKGVSDYDLELFTVKDLLLGKEIPRKEFDNAIESAVRTAQKKIHFDMLVCFEHFKATGQICNPEELDSLRKVYR